jgi:hypothetical protein
MKHLASPSFWELYTKLPGNIKELADRNFQILKTDPNYPSLHLKKVGKYWSVRIGKGYRALGVEMENDLLWFWIGSHADYDKMLR